jgi:hypothetical protein
MDIKVLYVIRQPKSIPLAVGYYSKEEALAVAAKLNLTASLKFIVQEELRIKDSSGELLLKSIVGE